MLAEGGRFATRPHAWPKLWKHHGAGAQADALTAVAAARNEEWLPRYGGVVGLEWAYPKALELFDKDRELFDATALWVEAGDWFTWQLVGGPAPPRSTCTVRVFLVLDGDYA
jgi:L-ribulokinase